MPPSLDKLAEGVTDSISALAASGDPLPVPARLDSIRIRLNVEQTIRREYRSAKQSIKTLSFSAS